MLSSKLKSQKLLKNFSFSIPAPRKLREVMQMSVVERENSDVIQDIWAKYHLGKKHNIARNLTGTQYMSLKKNLIDAPMFIYPVKRDGGHFTLIGQF